MFNKTISSRKAVYHWLYERRVHDVGLYFSPDELRDAAAEPYLSAALRFGEELGHLESKRGHWRMTAQGMLFAESENYVEGGA